MIRGSNILTILIFVCLLALAVLQWRWVVILGHAEELKSQTVLRTGVARFALEFDAYLIGAYIAFRPDPEALRRRQGSFPAWIATYSAEAMTRWNAVFRYPQLIRNVYWVEAGPNSNRFFVLQGRRLQMEPVDPPPKLADLFANLQMPANQDTPPDQGSYPRPETRIPALIATGVPAIVMSLDQHQVISQSAANGTSQDRPSQPKASVHGSEAWLKGATHSYLLLRFDLDYIRRDFVPTILKNTLAEEASNYSFVIVDRHDPKKVLFSSTASPDSVLTAPDAQALLFGVKSRNLRPDFPVGDVEGHWLLAVRKADTPVDRLAATSRFWTLATTFGSLILLTVSIALMMVGTRRLQSTASQQIDFVAGVSHELYSPLAVIRCAAENLAQGVHHSQEHSREYARLICGETERLAFMIDNTLEFAGIESGSREYDLRPVHLDDLVEGAIAELSTRLENVGMTASLDIPGDLPPVRADRLALGQVIRNLVINAVKYAREGRWLGISARLAAGPSQKEIVVLEFADRGPGIEAADLSQVLKPFYRGARARSEHIPGSGLGLALVTRIVAAHGGSVRVESKVGSGTRVSISLPTADSSPDAT